MTEKSRLVGYVGEQTARSAKAKADAADMSQSEWVAAAVEEKIEREGMQSAGENFRVEERLLDLVDQASERAAAKIVEEVRDEIGDDGDGDEVSDLDQRKREWGQ